MELSVQQICFYVVNVTLCAGGLSIMLSKSISLQREASTELIFCLTLSKYFSQSIDVWALTLVSVFCIKLT